MKFPSLKPGAPSRAINCRCCAMWTAAIICVRKSTGSTLAPMSGTAKPIGPTPLIRCPKTLAFSFIQTILSGLNGMSKTPWRGCRCWAPAGSAKSSTARSPMRLTECRLLARCPACPMRLRPASLPLASRRAAAPEKCWPNGSPKGKPNGICGPAIRAAIPITPIMTTAWPKAWRFMAMNTPCTSPGTNGPQGATRNCRPCTTKWSSWAGSWAPIMAGNGPTGLPNRAMTHPKKPPRHGTALAHGRRASAKNAKRCAMLAGCWICPDFPASGCKATAPTTGYAAFAPAAFPKWAA